MPDELTPEESENKKQDSQDAQQQSGPPPDAEQADEAHEEKKKPESMPADELESAGGIDADVEKEMLEELAEAEASGLLKGDQEGDSQGELEATEEPDQDGLGEDQPTVQSVEFDRYDRTPAAGQPRNIDLLLDVKLPVAIELGRTQMTIHDILDLTSGSVVELSKLAGEPVDLLVNDKVIARGEVVVVDENFGLRVTSLISPEERLKSL